MGTILSSFKRGGARAGALQGGALLGKCIDLSAFFTHRLSHRRRFLCQWWLQSKAWIRFSREGLCLICISHATCYLVSFLDLFFDLDGVWVCYLSPPSLRETIRCSVLYKKNQ